MLVLLHAKSEIWQPPIISGSHIKITFLQLALCSFGHWYVWSTYFSNILSELGREILQVGCIFPLLPMLTVWLWIYICLWRALYSSYIMYTPKCTGIKIEKCVGDSQPPIKVTDWRQEQGLLSLMTCCNLTLCTILFPWWELLLYFLVDSSET